MGSFCCLDGWPLYCKLHKWRPQVTEGRSGVERCVQSGLGRLLHVL